MSINIDKEEELLQFPGQLTEGSNSGNKRGPRRKSSKEGLKTKSWYKVAIEIRNRLEGKSHLKGEGMKWLTRVRE